MERIDTAKVCALLSAAFPNLTMSAETVEMWNAMLGDLDVGLVFRAAQDWILKEERYPTIAGIRKRCAEIAGVLSMSANEAWAEVADVVERYGLHNWQNLSRPPWSNEAISKTVKAIGWWEICQTNNPSTVRAQFIKMYNEFSEKKNNEVLFSSGFALGAGPVSVPGIAMVSSNNQNALARGEQ